MFHVKHSLSLFFNYIFMSFSIGIVGLPNVGKSTLFKVLTKKQVAAENYPFCTIDPNVGVVEVPDERLQALAEVSKSQKVVPTSIEFVDIAGLVRGAHQGEGLGNKFLTNIKETDAIVQVVRAFSDDNVIHVSGKVDPNDDIEVINLELTLADLSLATKVLEGAIRSLKGNREKIAEQRKEVLERVVKCLEDGKLLNSVDWTDDDRKLLKEYSFLTMKPFLYVYNVGENQLSVKPELKGIPDEQVIVLSAQVEAELVGLNAEESKEFLAELGIKESGLDQLIKKSYKLLNLITYFTSGEKETKAWTVINGSSAPQAAGKIHTDFEKGFIRAEVISWKDFVDCGGEVKAKEKGLIRLEGKEYIVQDGDTMHFRFSV